MTTKTKMSSAEAAKILRDYNEHRRNGSAIMNTATEIGLAIDAAIAALEPLVTNDIESIIAAVSRETGVTEPEMLMRGRQREYCEARAIVTWLTYHYTPMTLTGIGRRLQRDHTVAIYYNRMVDGWLEENRRNRRGARIVNKLITELDNGREC